MLNSIKLITGNSHPELGELVSRRLGVPLTECVCRKFADQSIDVRIGSSVRDQDVYVIQSGHSPYIDPNDSLVELLIILSACKTASARRITAVIPSFPYSRQTKKDKGRVPITAKMIANMITGVTDGFTKKLEIVGTGYRVTPRGKDLEFALGYSHPVSIDAPEGIEFDMWIASSSPMTLKIMTIAACVFVPIVLAYQAWSYWVFSKRLSREAISDNAVAA